MGSKLKATSFRLCFTCYSAEPESLLKMPLLNIMPQQSFPSVFNTKLETNFTKHHKDIVILVPEVFRLQSSQPSEAFGKQDPDLSVCYDATLVYPSEYH